MSRTRNLVRYLIVPSILFAFAGEMRAAPDGDRAMRHVLALAGEIGPRKTGTDADRRAVEYVRGEMQGSGLEVTLQEVTKLNEEEGERSIGSWNVIGRLEGATPDTIIVAAHHDSRNVLVPGANDDASGVAVLLEVARETAARPRRTGYLFVSFCAEEEGLLGSRFFARDADLSHVRAVIALELLGRGGILVGPAPKPPPLWAQTALLRAARETRATGAITRPLWTLVPRLMDLPYTADHEPFLEKGIPAFLLMGTFPGWTQHTIEDSVSKVRPEALGRAAVILDRLLRDLEEEAPARNDDPHYLPLTLFGRGLLVPGRALWALGVAAVAGSGLLVLSRLRLILSARAIGETLRVMLVTGAATALGLLGLFGGEALMESLHGVRFPWSAHQRLYVAQGIAGAVVTSWLALRLFRRIKPTIDPRPYFAAALAVPLAAVSLLLRSGHPELAAFMAVPLLALLLSRTTESLGRKLGLGMLGAVPLMLLLSLDDYRAAVEQGGLTFSAGVLFVALFLAVFPFISYLAHVASFQDCLRNPVWRWLSGRWLGGIALAAWLALLVPGALLPAYNGTHRQMVQIRQRVDLAQGRAQALVRSTDSLAGVRLGGLNGRVLRGVDSIESLSLPLPSDRITFEAKAEWGQGESGDPAGGRAVVCTTSLTAPRPIDRISYLFTSRSGFRVPGREAGPYHRYTFTQVAAQANPQGAFRLLLPEGGDLAVTLRADFQEDLLGLEPEGGPRVFVHEGTIVDSRRVIAPAHPPGGDSGATAGGSSGPATPLPGIRSIQPPR